VATNHLDQLMYSSLQSTKNSGIFAQTAPRYSCRNERRLLETSLAKGFLVKCRRPRCSLNCQGNWAYQHATCLARHLSELPKGLTPYRGNLTLPKGSSPAAHSAAKQEFCRILRRWKDKHGYILEIHAVLDITSPTEAHWDVVAYSDAPAKPLRAVVSDAWSRAGGLRQSLIRLDDEELQGQCKYQAKDTLRVDRRPRFLPADRSILGLDHQWSTADFWRGRTIKSIWSELVSEWFGDDQGDDDDARVVSNSSNTLLQPNSDPIDPPFNAEKAYQEAAKLAEFRAGIEARIADLDNAQTIIARIHEKLPFDDPSKAPTVRQVATQWGLPPSSARSLLIGMRGSVRIRASGNYESWIHDRYWIDSTRLN
jgi:hypothetical protein